MSDKPQRPEWRLGRNIPLNVYEADRPVCQCHNREDAARIVSAVNSESRLAQLERVREALIESLTAMAEFEAKALSHHRHREPLSVALDLRVMIDKILRPLKACDQANSGKEKQS